MPSIFVTGATGFIGSALCSYMRQRGWQVAAAVHNRTAPDFLEDGIERVPLAIESPDFLKNAPSFKPDVVVHLAGRAHILKEEVADPLPVFRRLNVEGTKRLAQWAAQSGTRRFIFISSIGVHGPSSGSKPFTEEDALIPREAYAVSKREAEDALRVLEKETGMETVILRPPLVYGSGAPGNFSRLTRLVKSGFPLPFGALDHPRSFIYIGNLVDAIRVCAEHPLAAHEAFLVSDGQDISTSDFVRMIARAMERKPALFSLPASVLETAARWAGKSREIEKLTQPLVIDIRKIKRLLGWQPPFTLLEGIQKSVGYDQAMR